MSELDFRPSVRSSPLLLTVGYFEFERNERDGVPYIAMSAEVSKPNIVGLTAPEVMVLRDWLSARLAEMQETPPGTSAK